MGLDVVEFVMSIEEVFQFRFPDQDMEALTTPRRLIDYLSARLPVATEDICLSQRAFYRLRSSIVGRIGSPCSAIRPDTLLLAVIPTSEWGAVWEGVRQDIGAGFAKFWPRLADRGWFDLFRPPRISTLREAVPLVVTRYPSVLMGRDTGWTRNQVSEVVHGLIREEFGYQRHQYTEDSRWDSDMGLY